MTSQEYTAQYAKKLKELYPQMQVTIDDDLALTIKVGDSYESKHWLDNSFAEYKAAPESFEAIVARYGKAALPRGSKAIDLSQVVPVVKDADWIRETNAGMKASSGCEMVDYVKEDICDGLMILYAQDGGDTITYLHADDLKRAALSLEALHSLALKNLQRMLKNIERHDSDGVYYYTAGGTYEASLILFPWMWTKENFGLDDDVVFAVPTRDVLFATSSKNLRGMERIRAAIAKIYADKPNYRLTKDLFAIVNGKIRRYEVTPIQAPDPTALAVTPAAGSPAAPPSGKAGQ